jgi:hypothetical protein
MEGITSCNGILYSISNHVLSVLLIAEFSVSLLTLENSIIAIAKTMQTSESIHRDRTVTSRNDGGDGAKEEEYLLSSRGVVIVTRPSPKLPNLHYA